MKLENPFSLEGEGGRRPDEVEQAWPSALGGHSNPVYPCLFFLTKLEHEWTGLF
ncbi:MAG: hypothetical protein QGF29_12105 [Verrucomicrobiota bacterium]|jgi:hypothetical protein|nr:hypothetical protein [Verrucomicrobiota bacterium]